MLIKIITGSEETGWIPHTRKTHKIMLDNPPERVRIRIRDFYVKSPDKDKTEVVSFELFNLMARRFFLEQEAEQKRDDRNLDGRELEQFDISDFNMDKHIQTMDLNRALDRLTETQRRRVRLHFFDGLTYEQIAELEGASWQSVQKSIFKSIEKIKMYFGGV